MKSNSKHFGRVKGRWVLTALNYYTGKQVFYRPKARPLPQTVLFAATYRSERTAKNAIKFMKRNGARLDWKPHKVKETELFLEVLKHG